jgi:hypothetical protein
MLKKFYYTEDEDIGNYEISVFKGGDSQRYNSFSKPVTKNDLQKSSNHTIGTLDDTIEKVHFNF